MLILTRKQGQRLFIGNDIIVTVTGVQRGQVQIGIEAPKDVPIEREEVRARKEGSKA